MELQQILIKLSSKIIIAIDGHSSTGKSTLASMLSKYLSYKHINTGLMYRAVTLNAIRKQFIKPYDANNFYFDSSKIINSLNSLEFQFLHKSKFGYIMFMNGEDVNIELKGPDVSKHVSHISKMPLVRAEIVKMQQKIGLNKGVVMEGRDIGSVVFPNAELKLFITASLDIRAKRRHEELIALGMSVSMDEVLTNLKMRDFEDSNRQDSPLIRVKDAILIDNSHLSIKDQFKLVTDLIEKKNIFS